MSQSREAVLILSAAMGGGHMGAAAQLARRLQRAGCRTQTVDLLAIMHFGYGRLINGIYHVQLRYAPWSYQLEYSMWRNHPNFVATANGADTAAARRNLLGLIDRFQPTVIISTYNLATQVLGELVSKGEIATPCFTFVTDFAVHPYWIHEEMDGYLVLDEAPARAIAERSRAKMAICGPLVDQRFLTDGHNQGRHDRASRRRTCRASLGLNDDDIAVLVVAGAWGVGDVRRSVGDLNEIESLAPIVVCGHNGRLQARLKSLERDADRTSRRRSAPARIIGFSDQIPELMVAADVLVENAGGMTSLEAFATDLPVITYRPIPGHGTDNADALSEAGVATFARNPMQLRKAISELTSQGERRDRQVLRAQSLFKSDPTRTILELIGSVS